MPIGVCGLYGVGCGPMPTNACLDEIAGMARGRNPGQLIHSTRPLKPFHPSVDTAQYAYQLFGYFLPLDKDWEFHHQAIGERMTQAPGTVTDP